MTSAEINYAQIEKEMLSIVHAATKFHCYVFGRHFTVFNDHKPLESIFIKPLNTAPMRLQGMLLKLQWYDFDMKYQKGETMHLSDTLSRAYLTDTATECTDLTNISMLDFISATPEIYEELKKRTGEELGLLLEVIAEGFPDSRWELATPLRKYWDSREVMSHVDGLVYKGMRIVVPPSLQKHMISVIHKSHLGIVKCKQRAREVLYWPGMTSDIENAVKDCVKCAEHQNRLQREPLKPTATPDYPFCEVGTDLFEFGAKNYIVLVDYYSKFIEVDELSYTTTTSCVIQALRAQFCRHGIPRILRSDNGPQFSSFEFAEFCKQYDIEHRTSSPYHQQANGEAERAIQTVKKLWKKCGDKDLALLDYRTTPLEGVLLSPAQLAMGRRPRNLLPCSAKLLEPTAYHAAAVKLHFDGTKKQQKYYYDKGSSATEHKPLEVGEPVMVQPHIKQAKWQPAIVTKSGLEETIMLHKPGSQKDIRRNRRHVRPSAAARHMQQQQQSEVDSGDSISDGGAESDVGGPLSPPKKVRTRSGRVSKPPDRYGF